MKRNKSGVLWLAGTMVFAGVCADALADAKPNPYDPIVERNPFGLKPPPPPAPPEDPSSKLPPPPLATVELTGITSILSSKRALLEVIPGPGKPMIKPILSEGERLDSIEVISINVEKNEVVVKNGGAITNLTFRVAKAAPGPAAPGAVPPPIPGTVPPPVAMQSAFNSQNLSGSGRNGVMMGGGNSYTPAASNPVIGGVNPNNPNYGGANAAASLSGGAETGFRSIPSRNIRQSPVEADPNVTRLQQYEQIEHARAENHLRNLNTGRSSIPLPPTPIMPEDAPGYVPPRGFPPLPR